MPERPANSRDQSRTESHRIPDYAPGGPPGERQEQTPTEPRELPAADARHTAIEAPPARSAQQERETAPRVTRIGRAATDAFLRTTPKGQPVAGFQLAVHDELDQTSYYTVLGFGDRATRLRDGVQKGDLLQVTGYLHTREKRGTTGKVRIERSIYAVAWGAPKQL